MSVKNYLGIIATIIVVVGTIFAWNLQEKKSGYDMCMQGSVGVCIEMIKQNKIIVKKTVEENIKINTQIEKLLSGTDFGFQDRRQEKLN